VKFDPAGVRTVSTVFSTLRETVETVDGLSALETTQLKQGVNESRK